MHYSHIVFDTEASVLTPPVRVAVARLKDLGYRTIGVYRKTPLALPGFFDQLTERTTLPELLNRLSSHCSHILYITDSPARLKQSAGRSIELGLIVWSGADVAGTTADYYFSSPDNLVATIVKDSECAESDSWLNWTKELQFISQCGLEYSKDPYDIERFKRIRELSSEIMSAKTDMTTQRVAQLFASETGYQTPKLDTRAAIFKDGKILLVKEASGDWSLPGGWVDAGETIASNTIKEVREESGLEVVPTRLIALLNYALHHPPPHFYEITKAFVLCELIGGKFKENIETVASAFFAENKLPRLSPPRNTPEQIQMCFRAYEDENWTVVFD